MLCVLSLCKMAGDGEGYTITCNTKCQKLIYDADTLQDANKQAAELRSWGYDVTIKSNSEAKS